MTSNKNGCERLSEKQKELQKQDEKQWKKYCVKCTSLKVKKTM